MLATRRSSLVAFFLPSVFHSEKGLPVHVFIVRQTEMSARLEHRHMTSKYFECPRAYIVFGGGDAFQHACGGGESLSW